jgi:hypothetical protein
MVTSSSSDHMPAIARGADGRNNILTPHPSQHLTSHLIREYICNDDVTVFSSGLFPSSRRREN